MIEHLDQCTRAIVVGAHDSATHFDTQEKKQANILSSSGRANHIAQCLFHLQVLVQKLKPVHN